MQEVSCFSTEHLDRSISLVTSNVNHERNIKPRKRESSKPRRGPASIGSRVSTSSANVAQQLKESLFHNALARASNLLRHIGGHDVFLSSKPSSLFMEKIVMNHEEKRSFVMVDVGSILEKWSSLSTSFPGVKLSLKTDVTGDSMIDALMIHLGSSVSISSLSDIKTFKNALGMWEENDMVFHESFSVDNRFGSLSFDTNTLRTNSILVASLKAGSKTFFIETVDEVKHLFETKRSLKIVDKLNVVVALANDSTLHADHVGLGNTFGSCGSTFTEIVEILEFCNIFNGDFEFYGFSVSGVDMLNASFVDALCSFSKHSMLYIHSLSSHLVNSSSTELLKAHVQRMQECCVQVVAEATEYLVASSNILATRVVASRPAIDRESGNTIGYQVFVDDGIYGCLCTPSNVVGKPALAVGACQQPSQIVENATEFTATTIWGQTCDSLDKTMEIKSMPKLKQGDWLKYHAPNGISTTTAFNGYEPPARKYFLNIESCSVKIGIDEEIVSSVSKHQIVCISDDQAMIAERMASLKLRPTALKV